MQSHADLPGSLQTHLHQDDYQHIQVSLATRTAPCSFLQYALQVQLLYYT